MSDFKCPICKSPSYHKVSEDYHYEDDAWQNDNYECYECDGCSLQFGDPAKFGSVCEECHKATAMRTVDGRRLCYFCGPSSEGE